MVPHTLLDSVYLIEYATAMHLVLKPLSLVELAIFHELELAELRAKIINELTLVNIAVRILQCASAVLLSIKEFSSVYFAYFVVHSALSMRQEC